MVSCRCQACSLVSFGGQLLREVPEGYYEDRVDRGAAARGPQPYLSGLGKQ